MSEDNSPLLELLTLTRDILDAQRLIRHLSTISDEDDGYYFYRID